MSKRYTIKRREASNIAKGIVLDYGTGADGALRDVLTNRFGSHLLTDDDIALIEQYYETHCWRVRDFLTR